MAIQTDISPNITNDEITSILQSFELSLNSIILYALLHGIYTGILAITLWNIFINKCRSIRRALIVLIISLYALSTISFSMTWSNTYSAFVQNGQSFGGVNLNFTNEVQAAYRETDLVLLDGLGTVPACHSPSTNFISFCICSLFIISDLDLGFHCAVVKGVAPTLLIGRAAAGHTRPRDEGDESTLSTLHFRTSSDLGTASLQESTMQSAILEIDIEAQQERSDELVLVIGH
ncbi:hypothetical protein ARMGADRAFT_1030829 [Armillaria gallica]|uniref:Uncharacterized protein n=1 Tax=Armillaria gallica TaxID=47427 RepID=A0A2H3DBE4_ARMGA|nr:hypothetical protein ARMGADRAFT_1030829 [Armillaria gallica]